MQIPRRDVELALEPTNVPLDWCRGDAFETTFMNALSLLFPEGERFFVDSVKHFKGQIDDPELQREITGFIGQEAMHGKEHRAFNELLVAHGYTESPGNERLLGSFLHGVRKTFAPASQLAATCALEHFTAMLAELLLRNDELREDMHPSIRPLWLWHALEESEHKSVAFDVYVAANGGYVRRVLMMLVTTVVFFTWQALLHARLMASRRILWKPWTWLRGATRLWIYPGYLTRLVPAYLAYFRPGFHPSDRDTRELLAQWETKLFGDDGALVDRVRVIA